MIDKQDHSAAEHIVNRQRLQLVMDNLPACIFWKDVEGCYLVPNQEFAEIAGWDSPDQLIGKTDEIEPLLCTALAKSPGDSLLVEA